jgi:hypothetical protein
LAALDPPLPEEEGAGADVVEELSFDEVDGELVEVALSDAVALLRLSVR